MTSLAAERRSLAGRLEPVSAGIATVVVVFGAIVGLGATNGGYFPSSWGWSALLFSWIALLALIVKRRVAVFRLELAYLAILVALLSWTALSLLWTSTTTQTVYEVERTLGYVTFAVALAFVARRERMGLVLGSVLAAVTALCAYALATRLLPGRLATFDPIAGYRLAEPLGYWNALAAIAAFGCILALGFAARARNVLARGVAAAALVILVPTLYFTFGRGGWAALFLGLAVLLLVDTRRLQLTVVLLAVAPWPAIALWRSYESRALTTIGLTQSAASSEGRRLAWTIAVLAIVAFAATALFSGASARVKVGPRVRLIYATLLLVGALGAAGVGLAEVGGPSKLVSRTVHAIRKPPVSSQSGDLTKRLFSLSSNGRLDLWSSSVDDARAHPLVGSGAGSFEEWWLRHRNVGMKVRDAHSLYMETLAELGAVGLLVLVTALVLPVVAAVRARAHPLVPIALAGFVAFLAHAAVDWDWEMPAVTVCGLAFAGCVLAAAPPGVRAVVLRSKVRGASAAVLLVSSAFAFVALTGNRALGQAHAAANRADTAGAARHARTAARWAPWSSEPIRLQADAALEQGNLARARKLYLRAIDKDSRNWELWLGLALASDGQPQRHALARAAQLNPLATEIRQLRAAGV